MSFYFTDGEGFYDHTFAQMLDCISDTMPEALPVRYGSYEPLQGVIVDNNFDDLVAAFQKDTDLFMKSKTPFSHIYLSVPCRKTFEGYHPQHFVRREFLMGHLEFELRPKVFSNPVLLTKLKTLFADLCFVLDVSYGEISMQDDFGSSWQWHSIPDTQPHTVCIGPKYQSIWPAVCENGDAIGSSHYMITTDRFLNAPPRPPSALIAPAQTRDKPRDEPNYAEVFPFDYQYDTGKFIW